MDGWLCLSRKVGEEIVLDLRQYGLADPVVVRILAVKDGGQQVRLGIKAPLSVPVHRREIFEAIKDEEH